MLCYCVKMTSFCSQRGEGVKKGQKIAVILNVWPLKYLRCKKVAAILNTCFPQEQDVEFDNEVETVVCIDDATTAAAEPTKSNSSQDPSKDNAEREGGEEEETSKAKLLSR